MILQLENVVAGYDLSQVLHGVSLEVDRGEIVAIMGRNGAGKSTLLKTIMGIVPPKSGSIRLHGREFAGRKSYEIARMGVGYVPDDHRIFPDLSVGENLEIGQRIAGRKAGEWTRARVLEFFPALRELQGKPGTQLSGGERKMLTIGRGLMLSPNLLLLDEPGEGLAPLVVRELVERLHQIRDAGVSILLADQNVKFCRRMANRAYVVEQGLIRYSGSMEEIWQDEEIIRRYLAV